ncbi:MAG: glycoside hydrolase domain-containing protein [Candidatus Hodarchaeota archaeon]
MQNQTDGPIDQNSIKHDASSQKFNPRYLWQLLFSWCLILVWSAFFCVYLEGKSTYDMAFTLWDDRYARVFMEPMSFIILPQSVFYPIFLVATAIIIAACVNRGWKKQFITIFVLLSICFILYLSIEYAFMLQTYPGARHGPIGWLIIDLPWQSLITFCLTNGCGLIGIWILMSEEFPTTRTKIKNKDVMRKWSYYISIWRFRIIIIAGMVLGSLALNAWLILHFKNVNAGFIVASIAGVAGIALLLLNKGILKFSYTRKVSTRFSLFTKDVLYDQDREPVNRTFDFFVNPRNHIWRQLRNVLNGILISCAIGLIAGMCFMTVPDEWVFNRLLDFLPWMVLGMLGAIVLMSFVPEPAIFFPSAFIYVMFAYNTFLDDFNIPFNEFFMYFNGVMLGFWIGILFSYLFFMYRAKDVTRNYYLMIFITTAFTVLWLLVSLVDRFQHAGDMVQRGITDGLELIMPYADQIAEYFLYVSLGMWGLDVVLRLFKLGQVKNYGRAPKWKNYWAGKKYQKMTIGSKLPAKRKKFASIALIIGLSAMVGVVQGGFIAPAYARPLLIRTDNYGIWTVPGVMKVERSFPISMPSYATIENQIDVSAAKGEWEGFHVLVTPQPGKEVTLTNINWSNFTNVPQNATLNDSIMEVFLVGYLVDEQPDTLIEYPGTVIRNASEHIDLFFRLRVPRNSTEGMYENQILLTVNGAIQPISFQLQVFNFTIPWDRHLRTAFGGGWQTNEWFDEIEFLRISQYSMGIPFSQGSQYWWNGTAYEFDWTAYDAAFQAQLNRGFTGIRQGYFPSSRPGGLTDEQWAQVQLGFLRNVSAHLESNSWLDEMGENHTWDEIPYDYWIDEPPISDYQRIYDRNSIYKNGTKLHPLLTEEFREDSSVLYDYVEEEYRDDLDLLHDVVDIWCPVIGNFEPSAVENRHAAGQEYWFYVCVGPTHPYPNLMLHEPGHNPRLLPLICARFNADGFLYWSMTSGNRTYRAGFEGNGDGQIAFTDPNTGRALPTLRLLSFSAGVEDFEYIWLMRKTLEYENVTGPIPNNLKTRVDQMESRLESLGGSRPQFVNHDLNTLLNFREDMAALLEDLWPYSQNLYP